MNRKLTSSDEQPSVGTMVEDRNGVRWIHSIQPGRHGTYWLQVDRPNADPEAWVKVAGNFGPVRILAGRDAGPNPRTRGGRPRVGPVIHLHLPPDQIERVDQLAEAWKATRSETIRRLLEMSLPPPRSPRV